MSSNSFRSRQCALADSLDRKVPLVPVSHCGQISAETLDRFLDYGSEVAMKLLEDARVRRGGRGVGNARWGKSFWFSFHI